MDRIERITEIFKTAAANPEAKLDEYIGQGKKVIGCFPYYAPEELVHAADMIPFGIWGRDVGVVKSAKQYFAPFYCTICQLGLEMGLNGKFDRLSGVIVPTLCDTLRPFSQNFRVAIPHIPFIFLAHPQNRKSDEGVAYTKTIYAGVKGRLEDISGVKVTDGRLKDSIRVYNENRAARRRFVELAGMHPDVISASRRSDVLKSAFFMEKAEHTDILRELNSELEKVPKTGWRGIRVVTTGIIADSRGLLRVFEDNNIAIVADDVAHESRAIRTDAPEDGDPITALAMQFADTGCDSLLFDAGKPRIQSIIQKVKEYGAQGVVVLMMQFCDPEEFDYPILKEALKENGIPHVAIGVDQQMRDYAQARTALQTFSEMLR